MIDAQPLTAGSLCSGFGGLEMGAAAVLGPLRVLWHAEYDPDSKLPVDQQPAARVLAARWPGVPNLGDMAAITASNGWADVPPVDVLLAGYPCQPFSAAGLRKGFNDPRNRWPDVHAAIRVLRPSLVILENVRGHLSRGFPDVAASLASIGYMGQWRCVRASDAGAAHRRERLYIVAWPVAQTAPGMRVIQSGRPADGLTLLPTPRTTDANGAGVHGVGGMDPRQITGGRVGGDHGPRLRDAVALLPTPTARDHKGAGWGDQPGRPLSETIQRLLPTPTSADSRNSRNVTANRDPEAGQFAPGWTLSDVAHAERWGEYAPAVARWEAVIGRPAPNPTVTGKRGGHQLSPLFVEWLMGLPAGHVTDVVTHRGQALRVLGNGVVPQAAALALRQLLVPPRWQRLTLDGIAEPFAEVVA